MVFFMSEEELSKEQRVLRVVKELILELSQDALQFGKIYPDKFAFLVNKYKDRCCRDDFIIKTHLIILQKMDK